MPPKPILDPLSLPEVVVADLDAIREVNAQRFEMEQLTAITLVDCERRLVVGYKDVRDDEFWVRGHMPGFPLMPGVMICEAAAQLCSYYSRSCKLTAGDFIGFGGMEDVRFRGAVRPGDRLWLVGSTEKHSNRRMLFDLQGFVGEKMVFHGKVIGVPITMQS